MDAILSQNGFNPSTRLRVNNLTTKAIKLASAVYRVTKIFSEGIILKNQLREKAGEIVLKVSNFQNDLPAACLTGRQGEQGDKSKKFCHNIKVEIEGLKALFEVAKTQNWVKPINFLILSQEYSNLEKEIEGLAIQDRHQPGLRAEAGQVEPRPMAQPDGRCSQILEYLRSNGRVQVGQVCQIFPQVSRRTLIRDLDKLSKAGFIERNGGGRGICYQIRQATSVGDNCDKKGEMSHSSNI